MDQFLRLLLLPIARFCIRHGIVVQTVEKELRWALVQAGAEAFRTSNIKLNVSRLSVMTGLYREEISRFLGEHSNLLKAEQSLITKVVGQWEQDELFCSRPGKPRVLTVGFSGCEFDQLVRNVSSSAGHAAVLTEMERKGLVKRSPRGAKLVSGGATFSDDSSSAFEMVRKDWDSVLETVEQNLTHDVPEQNLHIRTEYDNIYCKDLPQIRKWLMEQGKIFHRKARNYISRFDKDVSPRKTEQEAGAKVSLTAFSWFSK